MQKLLSDGKDVCLPDQIVLGEILACPSAKQLEKINFCLLDVNDFEHIQHLKKRSAMGPVSKHVELVALVTHTLSRPKVEAACSEGRLLAWTGFSVLGIN
ncbi:hypothetical protein MIDIC_240064 [Alphaproteobacteria bacterium]